MNNLIRYELKKTYKRKSFLVSITLMIILLCTLSCLSIGGNFWANTDGTEVLGFAAIKMEKEVLQEQAGELSTEKLQSVIETYQQAMNDPKNFVGDDGSVSKEINNAAFTKYMQPIGDVLNLLRQCFAPAGETYDYYAVSNLSGLDAEKFYSNRMNKVNEYLNMDYSYGNYSATDKAYFIEKNEKIKTPFTYSYHKGWAQLLSASYAMITAIVLVICICLAPMFSSEYQTGADAILLSTRYGKSKLIYAKIISAFILSTIVYGIGIAVSTISTLAIYGAQGWNCSLQVMNFLAPANVNLLQTYLYVLLAGYCLCLLMQGLTLLFSAKMSSPFPVIICMMVLFFVTSFIPYSRDSRLFNNIINLFPAKMAAAYTALSKYEVYHILGLRVSYPVLLIVIALLVATLTLPFAYKGFRKHQVA